MDYNSPGSFSPDAESHPRFPDDHGDGEFIVGPIVIMAIMTVVSDVSMTGTMSVKQSSWVIIPMRSVAQNPSMAAMMFFVKMFVMVPVILVPVVILAMIRPTAVIFRMDALFMGVSAMPVLSSVGPGSCCEYKHQSRNQHTDFYNFRFHCLASYV
jgi:hypothetical protein